MITNTLIPHLVCHDFSSIRKAIALLDSTDSPVTSIALCDESQASKFKEYICNFVDHVAIQAFRKGNRDYAYNLRFIKAMLCSNGQSAHINGFVGCVSKKSLFEAIKSIESYYQTTC